MNRIARAAVIGGIAMGAPMLLAPSAMAAPEAPAKKDISIFIVENATVGHNGPVYVVENGPGDLAYSNVTGSPKASPKVGNESVKTGDIKTDLKDGKGNTVVNEIEGAEQDSVKTDGKKHADKGGHHAKAEEAKPEAKPEAHAQEAHGQEAQAQEGQAEEAKPEAVKQEGQAEEAKPEAAMQEGQAEEAGTPEQSARTGGHGDHKGGHGDKGDHKGDHKGGPDNVFSAKDSKVGVNGPTIVAESGPGDLAFSNVAGSPGAAPEVGNESVKTGDFHTTLKDGKGNTAINEVEGSEQDSVK